MSMVIASGNILKMKTELNTPVSYTLPIGDLFVEVNNLIGKKIKLKFTGKINCIETGQEISKSYGGGFSYKAFQKLPQCDICIVRPELCHFDNGTCRDRDWGERHCMTPHVVYLSLTSSAKIGITREQNIPSRWVDQGAIQGLAILKVKDRLTSGLLEVEIAKTMKDKTNWRKMLKDECDLDIDLYQLREEVYQDFGGLIDEFDAEDLDEEIQHISYPLFDLPKKINSLSFDKLPEVVGTLLGIKGQYLILDQGVLNIRKHQGYFIELFVEA